MGLSNKTLCGKHGAVTSVCELCSNERRYADLAAERATHEATKGELAAAVETAKYLMWIDGEPPKYLAKEWFIAETAFGRLVLRSLPDEYAYDYTTADGTYIKADKILRWMQFPDGDFIPHGTTELASLRAELAACRADAERLDHIQTLAEEHGECWIQLTRSHDDRPLYQLCFGYDDPEALRYENVRAAIDAALAKEPSA